MSAKFWGGEGEVEVRAVYRTGDVVDGQYELESFSEEEVAEFRLNTTSDPNFVAWDVYVRCGKPVPMLHALDEGWQGPFKTAADAKDYASGLGDICLCLKCQKPLRYYWGTDQLSTSLEDEYGNHGECFECFEKRLKKRSARLKKALAARRKKSTKKKTITKKKEASR